jgi:hypothetical protein
LPDALEILLLLEAQLNGAQRADVGDVRLQGVDLRVDVVADLAFLV